MYSTLINLCTSRFHITDPNNPANIPKTKDYKNDIAHRSHKVDTPEAEQSNLEVTQGRRVLSHIEAEARFRRGDLKKPPLFPISDVKDILEL